MHWPSKPRIAANSREAAACVEGLPRLWLRSRDCVEGFPRLCGRFAAPVAATISGEIATSSGELAAN